MARVVVLIALLAGAAAAQEAILPVDQAMSVADPIGGVAGPFDAVPQTRDVFFGHDRESFDEIGVTTLSVLAMAAQRAGAGSVLVAGHTDTLGDAAYNIALSQRRARAIRGELIARGVPSAAITLRSAGQTDPAVATADGVAEPANRRVTVSVDGAGSFPAADPDQPYRFRLP